jgi:hypothetical protein
MLPFCSDQHAEMYDNTSMMMSLRTGSGSLGKYQDEFEKINDNEVDADNQGGLDIARDSISKLMPRVDKSIKYNTLSIESYDEYENKLIALLTLKDRYEPLLSNILKIVKKIYTTLNQYNTDLLLLSRSMQSRLAWINENLPY